VITAATPGEAIAIAEAREQPIDLLITDVVMPEMNGRDLVDRVHAHHPGLAHVFMSGYTADVIAHQGVLDEGVDFIQKPFSAANLAAKVREVLDRRR
jgi:YesN/AraC family two-component response regulator